MAAFLSWGKAIWGKYPTCSNLSESLKTSLLAASVSDLHFASFSKAESSRVRLQEGSRISFSFVHVGRQIWDIIIMHLEGERDAAWIWNVSFLSLNISLIHICIDFSHRNCLRRSWCKRKALSHPPSCPFFRRPLVLAWTHFLIYTYFFLFKRLFIFVMTEQYFGQYSTTPANVHTGEKYGKQNVL